MPFLKYSAGIVTDFDYTKYMNQFTGTTGIARSGAYMTTSSGASNIAAYMIFPNTVSEIWGSVYTQITNTDGLGPTFWGTDNSTILSQTIVNGAVVKAYARIGTTLTLLGTGTTVLSTNTLHTIETHYKRDSVNGIIQVWVDGILEIDFAGDTGAATDLINSGGTFISYYANTLYVAEIILTDKGRIGKKRMQLLYLSGSGDTNTADGFMDMAGNNPSSASFAALVKTGTWIIPQAVKAAGTLKILSFKLSAADTVKVGVFTKNPSSVKFTPDATRQASVACLSGAITLTGGSEIPEWSLTAGEYIGIWTSGKLVYKSQANDGDELALGAAYYIAGDAFSLGTEQTYSTASATEFIAAYAQYFTATNIMYLYNNDSGVITARAWQESKRYMAMSADNQEFLNNCTEMLDIECTSVNAIKVTVRGEAGTSITKGQLSVKIGGTTSYGDVIDMPTVLNKRHYIFEGTWSKAAIDALQVGFKARI